MFKIDKDIPIHSALSKPKENPFVATLKKMSVGDSFFCKKKPSNLTMSVRQAKINGKFSLRTLKDGCRIWRIE